jgi:hypothetical protein
MDIRQKKETILISWNAAFTLPIYENKKMNNLGRVRKGVKSFLKYFRKKGHSIVLLAYTEHIKRQPSANLKRHVLLELGYLLRIINTNSLKSKELYERWKLPNTFFILEYEIINWHFNFNKAKQFLKKRYDYTFLNVIKNIWRNK